MSFAVGDRNAFVINVAPGIFDLMVSASKTTRRFGFLTKKASLDWDISGVGADVAARFVEMIFAEDDGEWISFAESQASSF